MRVIFECCFKLSGLERFVNVSNEEYSEGIGTFIHGFWLDDNYDLVLDNMENYRERQSTWIPPSRIEYITRKTYETGEAA
jgi:hypothetical protein